MEAIPKYGSEEYSKWLQEFGKTDILEIKFAEPKSTIYLSKDSLKEMIENDTCKRMIFKDAKTGEETILTWLN